MIAGSVLAALGPAIAALGLAAYELMGCSGGGSSGPVNGCLVLGIEFNWVAALGTPALVTCSVRNGAECAFRIDRIASG